MNDEPYIFFADNSSTLHARPKTFTKGFYYAMQKIRIIKTTSREQNLAFHSHWHFLNSLQINAKILAEKVRSITVHLINIMTLPHRLHERMQKIQGSKKINHLKASRITHLKRHNFKFLFREKEFESFFFYIS
jgi:hypothetical protein